MARRRRHEILSFCLLVVVVAASVPASADSTLPGPATRIILVLPGQTLQNGAGVTGSPDAVAVRARFRVEAYAVDDFGNIDFAYQGPIVIHTDDPTPVYGRARGTSVSGFSPSTDLTSGSLRLSLDGAPWRTVDLGSPTTSQKVCDAIDAANGAGAPDWGAAAASRCHPVSRLGRYQAFLETNPDRISLLRETFDAADLEFHTLTVDPFYGSAPLLGLGGSANDPNDPNQPWEFAAARVGFLDVPPGISSRFSRGMAFFEVMHADHAAAGSLHSFVMEQAGVPPLVVTQTPYAVTGTSLLVEQVVLRDVDRDGAIDLAVILFSGVADPATLTGLHTQFELRLTTGPGQTQVVPGQSLDHAFVLIGDQAYLRSKIEVTFGPGIPTTGIKDVAFAVLPGAGAITSSETGIALDVAAANTAPLIDKAPPVLLSSSALDIDGNGGLDRVVFQFSEEVHFAAGSGVSASAPFAENPATLSLPSGSQVTIIVQSTQFDPITELLTLVDPGDPTQPTIQGADAIARSIQNAMRTAGRSAAALHFTTRFLPDAGRYILRSGIPGGESAVQVQPTGLPGDVASLLKLGVANGGVERNGRDADSPAIEDFIVLSPFPGFNLLSGMTSSDIVISDNSVVISLSNVPGSGVGTPAFFYVPGGGFGSPNVPPIFDDRSWRVGPLGALTDDLPAALANPALPVTNFPPMSSVNPLNSGFIRIRDTDSAPNDGTITTNPGPIQLDATPSLPPMNSTNGPAPVSFFWRQISGPATLVIQDPNQPFTGTSATVAGAYMLELAIQVREAAISTGFNSYLLADGSVRNQIRIEVLCSSDQVCDDSNACNGIETCDIPMRMCRPGTPPVEVCDGADNTCDGLIDEGFDVDADGLTQCAGDCNDFDPGSKRIPGEVTGLNTSSAGTEYLLEWDWAGDLGGADTHYDVFSGLMQSLLPSGNFSSGACFAEDLHASQVFIVGNDPPVSDARYFIVRAQNRCGLGTWGSAQRDLSVAASPMTCPVGPGGGCSPGGSECGTGLCVDGVCCDSSCAASCYRCDSSSALGICSPEPAGTPDPECGLYTCGAGTCNTSCMSQSDCAANATCDAATGQCM